MDERIRKFLESPAFGVVGASTNRQKYGNKVLRCYLQHGMTVFAVNPRAAEIEGVLSVPSVAELPAEVKSISVITPPKITEETVREAAAKGVENVWMQPGAESAAAIDFCRENGINVIGDGSCILVSLGYSDH
ncbi:MAG TPA: CoA-binding protein [Verrucomicrobiae bacterium]|nr:CoA-binding protein [Verrucomicrobiae bacterium]